MFCAKTAKSGPAWLSKAHWYLVLISVFAFGQSMLISGTFPISITSITRQLGYTNAQVGALPSLYDAVVGISSVFVTYLGHRAHKPRWLAIGAVVFTLGAAIMCIPGLSYEPSFQASEPDTVEGRANAGTNSTSSSVDQLLCSLQPRQDACAELEADYSLSRVLFAVFVVGELLMALGASPIYTVGVSFMDDNVDPNKTSVYMGTLYALSALGPAIGFLLGGVFLEVWVTLGQAPEDVGPESATWVGAWWLGVLLPALITAAVAPFFFFVPRELPGTEWIRKLRHKTAAPSSSSSPSSPSSSSSLPSTPPAVSPATGATTTTSVSAATATATAAAASLGSPPPPSTAPLTLSSDPDTLANKPGTGASTGAESFSPASDAGSMSNNSDSTHAVVGFEHGRATSQDTVWQQGAAGRADSAARRASEDRQKSKRSGVRMSSSSEQGGLPVLCVF